MLGRISRLGWAAVCGFAIVGAAAAQDAGTTGADAPTVNAGVSTQTPVQGAPAAAPQPEGTTIVADPGQTAAEPLPSSDAPPAAGAQAENAVSGEPEPVPAAYLTGMVRVPDAEFEAWLADPASLIAAYPEAGIPMSNYVRLLGGSDNRSIPPLISVAADPAASPPQVASIGAGLARAAQDGQVLAPQYAAYIQKQVDASNNPRLIAAFSTALANEAFAALAFGGGGGGSGGGPGSLGGGGDGGTVNGAPNEPIPQSFSENARSARSIILIEDDDDDDDDASPVQ